MQRIAVMYVCGIIADLEFSIRATAEATQKASFGIGAAQRAHRAAQRLARIQESLDSPFVADILSIYSRVTLKANNCEPLVSAADEIREIGIRFGAEAPQDELREIYHLLPEKTEWIWD